MLSHRRLEGHLIRVDVLSSAWQKAARQGDYTLGLYALALLCRGNLWTHALRRVCLSVFEDTNELVQPGLKEQIEPDVRRLTAQLKRHGVSKDTPLSRRVLFAVAMEVIAAAKSRMNANAAVVGLQYVAEEVKELRTLLPTQTKEALSVAFRGFVDHYKAKDVRPTLKWLTVLDLLGGAAKVWTWLLRDKNSPRSQEVQTLQRYATDVELALLTPLGSPRMALYEAVLYQLHADDIITETKERTTLSAEQYKHYRAYWDRLFAMELGPETRHMIEWHHWMPIVLDRYTAAGRNQNTLASLQTQYPDFPSQYGAPDHTGYDRVSPVTHFFRVAAQVTHTKRPDPYEEAAFQFFWNIERGQSLPVLGQGYRDANSAHIRKRLQRLIHPLILSTETSDKKTKRKRAHSVTRITVSSPSVSSISSVSSPAAKTRPTHRRTLSAGGLQASHVTNKAPCALPGLPDSKQGMLRGPDILEETAVTYQQMAQIPTGFKPPSWYIGLEDGSKLWIKGCAEVAATIPVYLDKIKPHLKLCSTGLRWTEGWLTSTDMGQGGPYPTVIMGFKRFEIVDRTRTGAPVLSMAWEKVSWTPDLLLEVSKILLFRAIYHISNTDFHHILWREQNNTVISIDEMSFSSTWSVPSVPSVSSVPLSQILFSTLPTTDQSVALEAYWTSEEGKQRLSQVLVLWDNLIDELPPPPRPIATLPTRKEVRENIRFLRTYFMPV